MALFQEDWTPKGRSPPKGRSRGRPAASRSLETAASAPWLRPEPWSRSKTLDRLIGTFMQSADARTHAQCALTPDPFVGRSRFETTAYEHEIGHRIKCRGKHDGNCLDPLGQDRVGRKRIAWTFEINPCVCLCGITL